MMASGPNFARILSDARSASARTRASGSRRSPPASFSSAASRWEMPTPIRTIRPLVAHLIEQRPRRSVYPIRDLGRLCQAGLPRQDAMVGALQLQRHGSPRLFLRLRPVCHVFSKPPDVPIQNVRVCGVFAKGGFVRDRLHRRSRRHPSPILASGQMVQPLAHTAEARDQICLFPAKQVGKGAYPRFFKRGLCLRPDAPDQPDRFVLQEGRRLGLANDRKPARLVEIGGHLGQKLVVRETDGTSQPQLVFHSFDQPRQHDRGRRVMQSLGACQIHEGFVQRQGFDHRRQIIHHCANLAADFDIGAHPAFNDHGVGAELQRLKHRHGRTYAPNPGDIAGG